MRKTILFTDLDGTLLDAESYAFADALPALERVRTLGIPLIFCSSKTRFEIMALRLQMGNDHPFISENGGGIFIPRGYFSGPVDGEPVNGFLRLTLGTPYPEIRERFVALRKQCGAQVRGFGDMTVAEVAALTGLDDDAAALAMRRDFDEPFVFEGKPDENFLRAIEADGLHWTQGRIFHILGGHDKGRAVRLLTEFYAREHGEVETVGLGDGLNDLPLLQEVEHPVLVRGRDGGFPPGIGIAGLARTQRPGPAGWNEAVLRHLFHATVLMLSLS